MNLKKGKEEQAIRLFIIAWGCFLLAGCQIVMDEWASIPQQPSALTKENIVQRHSDLFQLDWSQRKELDADRLYYVALGDSLTKGVGDERQQLGYTGRLAERLEQWPTTSQVFLDNRGKSGRRSDQLLALLEKGHYKDALKQAHLVTITIGGNDVMKIVRANMLSLRKELFDKERVRFLQRYQQLLAEVRLYNAEVPIVMVGLYNPSTIVSDEAIAVQKIIDEWNEGIEQLAYVDRFACFVSVNDLFHTNDHMVYHTDFFHPNANGYEAMTDRIVETLQACSIEKMTNGRIGFEE